jgi:mRNA interferase RelE/StbE
LTYRLRIKSSAEKQLRKIDRGLRLHIIEAIDRLRDQPTAGSALKGEFSGLRRLRVARYRVIYEVIQKELVILVVRIGHRGKVYR